MKIKKKTSGLKKREEEFSIEVSLPKHKKKASGRLFDYVMLLFGRKKIGKTSMCSELAGGNALFLMGESGTKALEVYERSVATWDEFRQYIKLLKKDKQFPLVILDPIDKFYAMCVAYALKKLMIGHLSEEDWGKGYEFVRLEFTKQIDALLVTGKGVIFISHDAEKKIKTRTGDSYELITATIPGQARDIIEGLVDIWAYYQYDGKERILTILGDDHIGAGHRVRKHFRYTDGKRIRNINMGRSEIEAAKNLVDAFDNKLTNPKEGKEKKKVSLTKEK